MKTTGIIRRVDDLGRVVIPKEIRRTIHIREGDPLEIYLDRGEIPDEWTDFRSVIKYDDTFSVSPIIYEGDLFGHILYRTADDPDRKIVRMLSNLICMLI